MIKSRSLLFNVVFILCSLSAVQAQYFEGGMVAGFTVSQIDGDDFGGYHQPGLTAGFYTYRQFGANLRGQMEIKYIAKGARATGTKENPMEYSQKLRYVELPIKAVFLLEKYKTSVETGIGTGYLFHEKGEFDGSLLVEPFRKFEIDWILGVSYHIDERLALSAQFNYSLIPVRKYENSGYNYGFLSRTFWMTKGDYNNVIQFLVYYTFGK